MSYYVKRVVTWLLYVVSTYADATASLATSISQAEYKSAVAALKQERYAAQRYDIASALDSQPAEAIDKIARNVNHH